MKVILIARVSTEEQRDAGNSLPAQVARLERYYKKITAEARVEGIQRLIN